MRCLSAASVVCRLLGETTLMDDDVLVVEIGERPVTQMCCIAFLVGLKCPKG